MLSLCEPLTTFRTANPAHAAGGIIGVFAGTWAMGEPVAEALGGLKGEGKEPGQEERRGQELVPQAGSRVRTVGAKLKVALKTQ